jgi:hypothetical protein
MLLAVSTVLKIKMVLTASLRPAQRPLFTFTRRDEAVGRERRRSLLVIPYARVPSLLRVCEGGWK